MSDSGRDGGAGDGGDGGTDHGAAGAALPERLQQRATRSLGQVDATIAQRMYAGRSSWAASRFGVTSGLAARMHAAGEANSESPLSPGGGPAQGQATDLMTSLMPPAVPVARREADAGGRPAVPEKPPPGSAEPRAAKTTAVASAGAAPPRTIAPLLARQIGRVTRPGVIDRSLAVGLHARGSFGVSRPDGGPMAAVMRRAAVVVQDGDSPEEDTLRLARRMDPGPGADAPLARGEADGAGTPAVREQAPGSTAPGAAEPAIGAPAAGVPALQSLAPLLARQIGRVTRPGGVDRSPGGLRDGGPFGVSRGDGAPLAAVMRRAATVAPGGELAHGEPPEAESPRLESRGDPGPGPGMPLARALAQTEAPARDGADLPLARAARTGASPAGGAAPSSATVSETIQRALAPAARLPSPARAVPSAPPASRAASPPATVSEMIQRAPAPAARPPSPAREVPSAPPAGRAASSPATVSEVIQRTHAPASGFADLPVVSRARPPHGAAPSGIAFAPARASEDPAVARAAGPGESPLTEEQDVAPVAPSDVLPLVSRPLQARDGARPEIASAGAIAAASIGSAPPMIQRSVESAGAVADGDSAGGAPPIARASEIAPASSAGPLLPMVWRRPGSGVGGGDARVVAGGATAGGASAAVSSRPGDGSVAALLRAATGTVQRQAGPSSSGDATPATPAMPATPASDGSFGPAATGSPAGRAQQPSVQEIAEQVARIIGRQLEVENERRGMKRWV